LSRDRQIFTRNRNKLTIAAVAGTLTVATAASAAAMALPSGSASGATGSAGAAFATLSHSKHADHSNHQYQPAGRLADQQPMVQDAKLAVARFRVAAEHRATLTAERTASGPATPAASGTPQSIAKSMLASFGWSSSQFSCLEPLWAHESGWNPAATNPSTGAYGIPQAEPGSKMASAGPDWKSDPATQIKWGLGYIKDTYGSPCGAESHEQADGWY
jgi:hypothetical protein